MARVRRRVTPPSSQTTRHHPFFPFSRTSHSSTATCTRIMLHPCLILISLILLCAPSTGQRRRARPPIVGEVAKNRIPTRATQCNFGNETYEIDEKWKPDLGPPVGVLFCVRCECVAANRKSRMVTRVKCKNIKHDCPKPECEEAVLLPGRCCKTCPGQEDAVVEEDLVGRKIKRKEEEGRKIYSLIAKSSKSTPSTPLPTLNTSIAESAAPSVLDDQEANDLTVSHKCYYEGNIFDDGSQWKAQHQDCQMCSCQVSHNAKILPPLLRALLHELLLNLLLMSDREDASSATTSSVLSFRVLNQS